MTRTTVATKAPRIEERIPATRYREQYADDLREIADRLVEVGLKTEAASVRDIAAQIELKA